MHWDAAECVQKLRLRTSLQGSALTVKCLSHCANCVVHSDLRRVYWSLFNSIEIITEYKSVSSGATPGRKQRQAIDIEEKLDVINWLEKD